MTPSIQTRFSNNINLLKPIMCYGFELLTTQAAKICYITNSKFQASTTSDIHGKPKLMRPWCDKKKKTCWPFLVVWAAVRNGFWLSKEANDVSDDGDYELLVHCVRQCTRQCSVRASHLHKLFFQLLPLALMHTYNWVLRMKMFKNVLSDVDFVKIVLWLRRRRTL